MRAKTTREGLARRDWWRTFFAVIAVLLLVINTIGLYANYEIVSGHSHDIGVQTVQAQKLADAGKVQIKFATWILAVNSTVCKQLHLLEPQGPQCPPVPDFGIGGTP
jgi:hypothetical protein